MSYLKLQTNDDKLIMESPDGVDEIQVSISTPDGWQMPPSVAVDGVGVESGSVGQIG